MGRRDQMATYLLICPYNIMDMDLMGRVIPSSAKAKVPCIVCSWCSHYISAEGFCELPFQVLS